MWPKKFSHRNFFYQQTITNWKIEKIVKFKSSVNKQQDTPPILWWNRVLFQKESWSILDEKVLIFTASWLATIYHQKMK